jgi:formylglycine-generating enzyme required for sulfatase activity/dienelactone hydrolase
MNKKATLASWKEIAAHLNRNVRTCQRWERDLGLPVHRLDDSAKARVFAYPAELDRWLEEKLHEHGAGPDGQPLGLPTVPLWTKGLIAGLAAAVVVVVAAIVFLLHRQARVRWANDVAIPEIEQLLLTPEKERAYELALRVERVVPMSPLLAQLMPLVSGTLSVETNPAGAFVHVRDYGKQGGTWELVGTAPLKNVRLCQGAKRWKISKPGFETSVGALFIRAGFEIKIRTTLDETGGLPPGMIRVPGDEHSIGSYAMPAMPAVKFGDRVKLEDYLLDRYEVTNSHYLVFIAAGGYRDRKYWKNDILDQGRRMPWEEAMRLFVDSTGIPGPATWAHGSFPPGADDLPVTGISWYEAAAYAEFAGKQLPSIFHWHHAAMPDTEYGFIIAQSNLHGSALAPGGQFESLGPFGTYDMAGNVKEWCWNESGGKRACLGGAWNEAQYWFVQYDGYPPLTRGANIGFRCMKPLGETPAVAKAFDPLQPLQVPDYGAMAPCSGEVFEVYRHLYSYTKTPLNPRVESRTDWSPDTTLEKVSFDDASGGDRIIAYLFLPRRGPISLQSVVYFPGIGAWSFDSIHEYGTVKSREVELYTKSGRAFVFPVFTGTFERKRTAHGEPALESRERWITYHRELARCLDYLETRPEFDPHKIAYKGLSKGAWCAPIHLALEKRFKAAILLAGGLFCDLHSRETRWPGPEWDPINFAPRVSVPVLMQNGTYDTFFPLESAVRGLFRRLGTPAKDKHLLLYPTGHSFWVLNQYRQDVFDFLDKYLGPVGAGAAAPEKEWPGNSFLSGFQKEREKR